MELEFTTEQEELRSSVRSFLEKECPIAVVRTVVETGEPARALWDAMVALDWPALGIPEEDGGLGLSVVETAVVAEELGRAVAPGPLLATVTQFAPMVREAGSPEQRRRFLPEVAAGRMTGAVALADHPRGGTLDDVTMTAEPGADGWVLDGVKHAVLADPSFDELAVVARVGDGFGAFVVPASEAGLQPVHPLDASRPLGAATLRRVVVPGDRALGEPGSTASTGGVVRAVQEAMVALALETVGACDALFSLVLAYVKERHQFGVPVGSFQAVKHKMSDMFLAVERARALCYYAVAAIDEDAPERASAVAMAKAASDDCRRLVCQDSIQSLGGIGFTWEHDAHLFVKRAGTSGALLGGAARHSLGVAAAMGVGHAAGS
ncbi:MAG TPA: acyl-CoA dehydrogenase family protein [Acidimicrobiales bacterium]|nr:acyl-CoA dehydrogenase family protein [Acidimicrobiales bacterium]